ncbi:hypothetical protein BDY21DRAFT_306461 [Lineolata rhizophorae]|uniref:DUF1772-domain-containing protein n=1 Tax=Lineolata rhizophorae TaxID=578093 RepID=A0A6A6NWK5_9PEZI|nr:hypothetical protein BDY21DRAFT_306461 [Lineolata rhizophorae]
MTTEALFIEASPPLGVRIAQVVGLTTAGFLAGQTTCYSLSVAPSLMDAPAPLLAKQFKKNYDFGKIAGPAMSLVSSLSFGYLAGKASPSSPQFKLYTVAAILGPAIVPYTFAVMMKTNKKILAKAAEAEKSAEAPATAEASTAEEENTHALVDKWATMNLGRGVLTLASAILGAWAAVSKLEIIALRDSS